MDNDNLNQLSTVRRNLLTVPEYTPYCGNNISRTAPGGCHNPRTKFDRKLCQFVCPNCGFTTNFNPEFIQRYLGIWYPNREGCIFNQDTLDKLITND